MHLRFFLSGHFTDTFDHLQTIQTSLADAGLKATIKRNDAGPSSKELIEDADAFVAVLGLEEGPIKTPFGDTLPQMELNYAIRLRKPVIAFVLHPECSSPHPRQQHYRTLVGARLGQAVIGYSGPDLRERCRELLVAGPSWSILDGRKSILTTLCPWPARPSRAGLTESAGCGVRRLGFRGFVGGLMNPILLVITYFINSYGKTLVPSR